MSRGLRQPELPWWQRDGWAAQHVCVNGRLHHGRSARDGGSGDARYGPALSVHACGDDGEPRRPKHGHFPAPAG